MEPNKDRIIQLYYKLRALSGAKISSPISLEDIISTVEIKANIPAGLTRAMEQMEKRLEPLLILRERKRILKETLEYINESTK